jgi:hypothetical protein
VDLTVPNEILRCANCGSPLNGDPDEDPTGDAGMPICGNCARERDWFDIEVFEDGSQGDLDRDP